MIRYPACYTDANGTEKTTINNDGEFLSMSVRGLVFSGKDFDNLTPPAEAQAEQWQSFTLNEGALCACRLAWDMDIPLHNNGHAQSGILAVELHLGSPTPKGKLNRVDLQLTLSYDDQCFSSAGSSGWFEDELLDIQKQLPSKVLMRICINCLFADYSPYGHGLFGTMLCFRNLKREYLKVKSKDDFWSVHDHYEQLVQETHACNAFKPRIPGTGYRG